MRTNGRTDQPTDKPTNGQTNIISYRGATSRLKTFDFAKADYDGLRKMIGDVDWTDAFKSRSVEDSWALFKNESSGFVADCISLKARRSGSKPPWMNRDVLRLVRQKRRLWKSAKSNSSLDRMEANKAMEKKVKKKDIKSKTSI
jgi:hypothetical protein